MHQIETHGHQRKTEEDVESTDHQFSFHLRRRDRFARHEVTYKNSTSSTSSIWFPFALTQSNGGQGDKAEVSTIEKLPILPLAEEHGAQNEIRGQQRQGHTDRNGCFTVVDIEIVHELDDVRRRLRVARIRREGAVRRGDIRRNLHGLQRAKITAFLHHRAVRAADVAIDEPKGIGHGRSNVRQTQQHQRNAEDGVDHRHDFAVVRLAASNGKETRASVSLARAGWQTVSTHQVMCP